MQKQKAVGVMSACAHSRAAADASNDEEHCGKWHHDETEQPVRAAAAPDQIRADDEPDKEIERAGPRSPGETVLTCGLDTEERGLHEPTETHAPRCGPPGETGTTCVAEVADGGFAVEQ